MFGESYTSYSGRRIVTTFVADEGDTRNLEARLPEIYAEYQGYILNHHTKNGKFNVTVKVLRQALDLLENDRLDRATWLTETHLTETGQFVDFIKPKTNDA